MFRTRFEIWKGNLMPEPRLAPCGSYSNTPCRDADDGGCICDVSRERDAYRDDADFYRTAIERWYDLSQQRNINGSDGPIDEWKRAVDALRAIATGERA